MPFIPRLIASFLVLAFCLLLTSARTTAQTLTFATVDRPPFAEQTPERFRGFSIDLMQAIGAEIGRPVTFVRYDRFADMFAAIAAGEVDGAIANISITAERERILDFSQPIFASGFRSWFRPTPAAAAASLGRFSHSTS
ncbi:transporter substrate-binding domain-containing protein [Rhodobacteraceae bacterium LMO-12]|nr:transporter substrate-binding domain-containing protein [Rhodobacteraceae bacterium LMO-JJ12]